MIDNKVVPIKGNVNPLFNGELRHKLEESTSPYTQEPQKVVETVEQVICSFVIAKARGLATRLGTKIGEAIVSKIS
jgi:hypothetical protein